MPSNYPNGLASFGIPIIGGGGIPAATGTYFFVDPAGNNGNDGLSIDRPVATITRALALCTDGAGDVILVAPGAYNETVTVSKSNVTIIGLGGRGAAYIEPSTAGAEGMQVTADDVTVINLGIAGDDTADYALNLNSCSRFRAYGCKIELADGAGSAVLIDGTADDQTADALFEDCEVCWAAKGFTFDDSAYGYPTQIFVKRAHFHNITTNMFGVAASGLVKNLLIEGCTFDRAEDGTGPTDYILLSDNGNTGLIANNSFAHATNQAAVLTIGSGLMWVANRTEAGISTARPA